MAPTMKDIAKKAKVSMITVSRAMNNRPDISRETKSRILKIARELNYTPDLLARSLVTRKTKTVAVLVPDNVDPFYAAVVQGIGDECRERGYGIFLWNTHDSADKELEYLRQAREKRTDGMLIYPVQADSRYIKELRRSPVPFVFLNRHADAVNVDYVINDNVHGAYLAVNHLVQKGHKHIAYICAKPNASSGKERIAGCRKAIQEAGLPSESLELLVCEETIASCYKLVKELVAKDQRPSAIFVWDDRLAIGAMKAIGEANLRIPQDMAIVGYDDIESSEFLHPPLTTVHQPTHQIGETAARILLDKLESEELPKPKKTILKPELVVRDTT
jgi:LacI family transcriptional regulator